MLFDASAAASKIDTAFKEVTYKEGPKMRIMLSVLKTFKNVQNEYLSVNYQ